MTQPQPPTNDRVGYSLRHIGRAVLDMLLPSQCLSCDTLVEDPGTLCVDCWQEISFIGDPHCDICGLPFELAGDSQDIGDGLLCGSCVRKPPVFDRARAAFAYDEHSRGLILAFKHADRTDSATPFAGWMIRAGAGLLADADLIVPVPLHYSRLFSRRYNQSALLAVGIGRLSGIPVNPDLLVRTRRTPSQGKLSPVARRRNVGGAFKAPAAAEPGLAGRRVLLIDDVLTSGATASAATRALLRGGAKGVDVLTLSRVPKPIPV
ncbi:MAG: ComF family protein [Rhodospirillaceae bacterium]|nr:ComF family protein [Rhodospirillaceae bacterium]